MTARPASHLARLVALALHVALLAGLPAIGGLLGALAAVPLLAPLRGLARGSTYTAGWTSLLMSWYAGILAAEVWFDPAQRAALVLAVIAGVEFSALLLFVRLSAREGSARPTGVPGAG